MWIIGFEVQYMLATVHGSAYLYNGANDRMVYSAAINNGGVTVRFTPIEISDDSYIETPDIPDTHASIRRFISYDHRNVSAPNRARLMCTHTQMEATMELNDLVKMLVKAENPRQHAIEQAQAPKPVPAGTQTVLPFGFNQRGGMQWVMPSTPNTTDVSWTTTSVNTIGSSTNAVVFSSVTG